MASIAAILVGFGMGLGYVIGEQQEQERVREEAWHAAEYTMAAWFCSKSSKRPLNCPEKVVFAYRREVFQGMIEEEKEDGREDERSALR
jgi:hypothetical protein